MFNLFKKAFGLDISDFSIEFVSLTGSFEKPRLLAMGRILLEPNIVEDGKILNKETLRKKLEDLIRSPKFGKLKTNKFVFSLPESRIFVNLCQIPNTLKKKEELDFIKSEACQILPASFSELYFDFEIIRKKDLREALLVAAPKNIVNDYLEVFRNLKLQPIALEIESLSLGRSLIQDSPEPVLIVDVGARTTNFSIFDSGRLRFSYTIDVAGNKFTISLADGLGISLSEAESLKKRKGLDPGAKRGKSFLILQRDIQVIVLEIRNIEEYFQKKEKKEIKKIVLAGGSAMLPFLPQYLEDNLAKPVVIADPWSKINIDILKKKEYFEKALEINPALYSTCIGSAMRGLLKNPRKTGINLVFHR